MFLFCLSSFLELLIVKFIEEFIQVKPEGIGIDFLGINYSMSLQNMLRIFLGIILSKFIVEIVLNFAINKFSYVFQNSILHNLLPKYLLTFDPKISIEKKLNLLLVETRNLSHFYIKPIIKITYTVLLMVILLGYLISIMGIEMLIYVGVIGIVSMILINTILSISKKAGKQSGDLREYNMNFLADILNGSFEIKYFDALENFKTRFFKSFHRQINSELKKDISSNLFKPIIEMILLISFVLLIFFTFISNQEINFAQLGVILFLMLKIIALVQQFTSSSANIKFYSKSLEVVFNEFRSKENQIITFGVASKQENIFEIDQLNYDYQDKKIFQNFSVEITKNEIYYLKGPSGKGKTTLLNILSGNLMAAGVKLNPKYTIKDILYLRQDPHLFEMSLLQNATMLNDQVNSDQISHNLKKVRLEEQIQLSDNVGPRGSKTSGGQKQKVNLLRVLLKSKPIIFLDEAFNSIDKKTRDKLFKEIIELKPDLIVFTSHDEDLVKFSTKIIDMDRL